jgi:N-acetylneuraminic acid mutarotase
LGVADPANHPGAREVTSTFVDANGNFWLFGGVGYDDAGTRSHLNDLWMLNPSTRVWTWEGGSSTVEAVGSFGTKGTASASNSPGARRYPASWKDSSGNFWLLGGDGYANSNTLGALNDLWIFNVTSKQWTWVGGSDQVNALGIYGTQGATGAINVPGSRDAPLGITDVHGNFWLLGGYTLDKKGPYGVALNDLWRFHP